MTTFSSTWLSLREPRDALSRSRRMVRSLRRLLSDRPIQITDLASGTGANLRFAAEALGGRQNWSLIDHDRALLDAIPQRMQDWAARCGASVTQSGPEIIIQGQSFECRARVSQQDLAPDLAAIDLPALAPVTASALLDLVSDAWLTALAQRCCSVRAPVLFALTYDGQLSFNPPEPEDDQIRELINIHQTGDKGFGPALGPAAALKARRRFAEVGYHVELERSDWQVGPADGDLQLALLDGWLSAAMEIAPQERSALEGWLQRRRAHVASGRSALRVGHVDVLGWLPD